MTDPALCAEGAARASGHRRAGDKHDELAAFHVWMAPAWQEKM